LFSVRWKKPGKGCVGLVKNDWTADRYAAKVYLHQRPGRPAFFQYRRRGKNDAHEMRNWCARNYFFTASFFSPDGWDVRTGNRNLEVIGRGRFPAV